VTHNHVHTRAPVHMPSTNSCTFMPCTRSCTRELNWWLLFLSTVVRARRAFEGSPPPSRLVFVRIYPRQFCHKQQRPNSTLQLFNFWKPRSVSRALTGFVSPVHLLSFSQKIFLKKVSLRDKDMRIRAMSGLASNPVT
jgi:hypothetical protein